MGPRKAASPLNRTPSLSRDGSLEAAVGLARSLTRSVLPSRQASQDSLVEAPTSERPPSEQLWPPQQQSQTLPRSYKLHSGGGPQLSAAWRDAVAKASTVLSRSSSRSSLKSQAGSTKDLTSPNVLASVRSTAQQMMNREQSDFGHTLPKSYTQLRSAMAENQLLAPRREEEKRAALPVQTVLTVQVRTIRLAREY